MPEPETTLELRTLVLVRELADGSELCAPVADLKLASHGRDGAALADQRLFLEEYLRDQRPEVLARFALPAGTRLEELEVQIPRDDLPERLQLAQPITVCCVVLPQGRDHWVLVPALDHTFHMAPDEDLAQAVEGEVRRMVLARDLTPVEFARLLPPRAHRLEEVVLQLDRSQQLVPGRGRAVRRAALERRQAAEAREVLDSVGEALHGSEALLRAPPLAGRDRELGQLAALLEGEQRRSVLLVGPSGSGKSALLRAWVRALPRSVPQGGEERGPRPVYSLSGSRLVAGMSGLGQWQERVLRVMTAAERLDAVLVFDDLTELLGDVPGSQVDVAGAMRAFLDEGRVRVVGELEEGAVDRFEHRHLGFLSALQRLRVEPLTAAETSALLEARVAYDAKHAPHRPTLAPAAIPALLELVDRYLPHRCYPGKAVRLYEELRSAHEQSAAAGAAPRLGEREIYELFSLQTGVPLFLLRQDQPLKLEELMAGFRRRLVGQDDAVRRVAQTVCVVKARLQPAGKPLATFLFVGPTGVGKTELARSLAAYLFGDEARMTRFDMSEYMDALAAERLIRGSDRAEGLLTRRVRQQPFCVLLLDEIEKAHPAVFDLLLQVCGEGRLTDAGGRIAHFHNAIIIMTSNLGAAGRRSELGLAATPVPDARYYEEQVAHTFRPEFVNRIDRVVTFHALTAAQIEEVARLTVVRLAARRGLAELGVELAVSEGALLRLAREGYSAAYGARALRRHLEDHLVAPAARLLALCPTAAGARLVVDEGDAGERGTGEGRDPSLRERTGSALAETREGWLRLRLLGGQQAPRGRGARAASAISALRREADRHLQLEEATEVRDQLTTLLAQLSAVGERRAARDPRAARERTEMLAEHTRLAELWERATARCAELHELEELAISALLAEEDPAALLDEATRCQTRFLEALYYVLLARRPHRDAVTLLAQELDEGRALDRWLVPLLESLEARRWHLTLHADAGARGPSDQWPATRRWGPPRDALWALERLAEEKRPFRACLLRVSGPWAGVSLALEAGLHAYPAEHGGETQLLLRALAPRVELSDAEWELETILPALPTVMPALRRMVPVRYYETAAGPCTILRDSSAAVPLAEYWRRLEQVGVQELLHALAQGDDLPSLFTYALPAAPFKVTR